MRLAVSKQNGVAPYDFFRGQRYLLYMEYVAKFEKHSGMMMHDDASRLKAQGLITNNYHKYFIKAS